MRFGWDPEKNKANQKKHGLNFETAQLVFEEFEDPYCIQFVDRIVDGEERWQAIGLVDSLILIVVAHAYREAGSEESFD